MQGVSSSHACEAPTRVGDLVHVDLDADLAELGDDLLEHLVRGDEARLGDELEAQLVAGRDALTTLVGAGAGVLAGGLAVGHDLPAVVFEELLGGIRIELVDAAFGGAGLLAAIGTGPQVGEAVPDQIFSDRVGWSISCCIA